jgi:membrane protease subunit HflK
MYLETVQQVLESTSKIIVDQKGSGSLLYLPLDKLIQGQSGGAPAAAPAAAAPEAAQPQAQRSREAFRSRERESR